uniref:Uncharacterized protein n=1 Tax=Setaria viridis TaxID=4556 RepID=A0A4V6D987_SETVI|nr:hypothetical protein SEVIR_3G064150v2 [Setaria viridis]
MLSSRHGSCLRGIRSVIHVKKRIRSMIIVSVVSMNYERKNKASSLVCEVVQVQQIAA